MNADQIIERMNDVENDLLAAQRNLAEARKALASVAVSPEDGDLIIDALEYAASQSVDPDWANDCTNLALKLAALRPDDTDPRSLMSDEPPHGSFPEER